MKAEQNAWREVKYREKFLNAFRGLYVLAQTTRHLYIHLSAATVAVVLGFYFRISGLEWVAIIFAIGFVFVAESFNTALEIDMDLTSPQFHPYARDTKDVAAAAVLLAVFSAGAVGLIIFLPYFIAKIF